MTSRPHDSRRSAAERVYVWLWHVGWVGARWAARAPRAGPRRKGTPSLLRLAAWPAMEWAARAWVVAGRPGWAEWAAGWGWASAHAPGCWRCSRASWWAGGRGGLQEGEVGLGRVYPFSIFFFLVFSFIQIYMPERATT
jgi:hypothetical protein